MKNNNNIKDSTESRKTIKDSDVSESFNNNNNNNSQKELDKNQESSPLLR